MEINKALNLVLQYYQSHKLKEAEQSCRAILKAHPENVEALHFLGIITLELGQDDLAIQYIKTALQIDPSYADAYNNLGNIYQKKPDRCTHG